MIVAETERLILRRLTMDDLPAMETVGCDPEVMKYSDGVLQPAGVKHLLNDTIRNQYGKHGFGPWAVVVRKDGAVAGYCGLSRELDRCGDDEGELGYRLARAYWGNGYATEAARAAIDAGFAMFGLARVVAIVDPANTASVAVLGKLGMAYEREITFPWYDHPDHVYAAVNPAPETPSR